MRPNLMENDGKPSLKTPDNSDKYFVHSIKIKQFSKSNQLILGWSTSSASHVTRIPGPNGTMSKIQCLKKTKLLT